MHRNLSSRLLTVWIVLGLGTALLSCANEESMEFTALCSTTMFVAGYWNATFRCENGSCVAGNDRYLVSQELSDLTQVTAEIVASSLPSDVGVVFEGELCNDVFTWEATNPGNDESGSWTFVDLEHFTKTSTFDNEQYTCVGQGTKEPLPLPAEFFCPLPQSTQAR
ncbi:MAG: hypothetical protein PVJ64_03405 [Gemmatimonadales bacterium]|jgi:hypothetical protein